MTFSFNRILLATEHTEFDAGAERLAFELAKECATPLLGVLPMVSNVEYEAVAPQVVAQAEEEAYARLTAVRAAARAADVDLDIRVRRGEEPYREIIAEAQARDADLIVARRRGKRGFFAALLVGEMVSKVATHAPCNVLLVPRAGRMWSTRVVASVDASPAAQRVVDTAANIAASADLPLLVTTVVAHNDVAHFAAAEAAVAGAVEIARRIGAKVEGRVLKGRPGEVISGLAAETGADLIVVGRTGESGRLHRLLLGGAARRIIGLAPCPVLVVRT